jgi:hypothetical protein
VPSRTIVTRCLALLVLGPIAAVLAALAAESSLPPAPELHEHDFRFERKDGSPLEITPDRPLILPFGFGDFELWFELEAPVGGEVDVVARLVEPTLRDRGLAPFHARYSLLRLSTVQDGEPFRTREAALFDDDPAAVARGGVRIAGGLPATVTVSARGRCLAANVAGRRLPTWTCTDAHGQLALVVRGGSALVHAMELRAEPRPLRLLPVGWCALAGLGIGLAIAWLAHARPRGRPLRLAAAFAVLVLGGAAGGRLVLAHVLPEAEAEQLPIVATALAFAPLAIALARRIAFPELAVGVLAAFAALEYATRSEAPRLRPFEDARLTAYLGEDSGPAAFDVLVPRMRARDAAHTALASGERVVFLGGGPLFESDPDYAHGVAPLACARAARALPPRRFDGATMPTVASHLGQQLACWSRWYERAFDARAIVLALPAWEAEPLVDPNAAAVLAGAVAPAPWPLRCLELVARAAAGTVVGADPATWSARLADFATRCAARGTRLLLLVDPALATPYREALASVVAQHGLAVLELDPVNDALQAAERIGDALAALMR